MLYFTLVTPSCCVHIQVRNEKARRFLLNMRKKPGVELGGFFPRAGDSQSVSAAELAGDP